MRTPSTWNTRNSKPSSLFPLLSLGQPICSPVLAGCTWGSRACFLVRISHLTEDKILRSPGGRLTKQRQEDPPLR